MSVSTLSNNLQEIYVASLQGKDKMPSLVADISGCQIYYTRVGWGRVWTWVYGLLSIFGCKDMRAKKLARAMQKTHESFTARLPVVQKATETYRTYLEKKSLGVRVNECDYHLARKRLTDWNVRIKPLVQSLQKHCPAMSTDLFGGAANTQNSQQELDLQFLIDLEGRLRKSLPLDILKKLATKQPLKEKENKTLSKWICHLNKMGEKFKVGPFHDALIAYIKFLGTFEYNKEANLVRLEYALLSRNLQVFKQKEEDFLKWRASLRAGDNLFCREKAIVLGEQIGKKSEGWDGTVLFAVEGDAGKVVALNINRALPAIKTLIGYEEGACIHNVKCIDVDTVNGVALHERLTDSLAEWEWQTTDEVHPQDVDRLTPLVNNIKWMIQHQATPHVMYPKRLMFDNAGILKSTRPCIPREFDYMGLETYAHACSKGNRRIFSYIMDRSGLFGHSYRTVFHTMAQKALEEVKVKAEDVAAIEGIIDSRVVDKANKLYYAILELKKQCLMKLHDVYHVPKPDAVEASLKLVLLELYNNYKSVAILWPQMEEDAVAETARKQRLQKREPSPA